MGMIYYDADFVPVVGCEQEILSLGERALCNPEFFTGGMTNSDTAALLYYLFKTRPSLSEEQYRILPNISNADVPHFLAEAYVSLTAGDYKKANECLERVQKSDYYKTMLRATADEFTIVWLLAESLISPYVKAAVSDFFAKITGKSYFTFYISYRKLKYHKKEWWMSIIGRIALFWMLLYIPSMILSRIFFAIAIHTDEDLEAFGGLLMPINLLCFLIVLLIFPFFFQKKDRL
jgi:hypothetical protein